LSPDEAESAINALTILDHGVPGDHFLGLPLFENTLVRPWPESAEYEFRDLSYSDRGLAIYHGWLPLYAIAGALRLAGVTPEDARRGTPPADGSSAELRRWTAVPRWPSIAFSALFIVLCFGLGRGVYGTDAGWAMATAAALSNILVFFGRQARYYSATLALDAACGLAVWNACRRGRLRDHALAGLSLGLLFHTHVLASVSVVALYAVGLLVSRGQPRRMAKGALGAAVLALLVFPWAWWSGFLHQSAQIPPARDLLDFVSLLRSPSMTALFVLLAGTAVSCFGALALLGDRVSERWRRPFLGETPAFLFAVGWLTASYAAFVTLIPAASYFTLRLNLVAAVPGLLLTALVVAAVSRAVSRGRWPALAPTGMLGLLLVSGQVRPPASWSDSTAGEYEMSRLVRSWRLGAGARVYALPNSHLLLTYYTGVPVQSVSAVRRAWLDGFDRDLVIVDDPWYETLSADEVALIGRRYGRALTPRDADARSEELRWLLPALELDGVAAEVSPRPRVLDDFDRALVDAVRAKTRLQMDNLARGTPLVRAATLSNWREFWQFFFYWFAHPESRLGEQLNYHARLRRARAHVLPSGWIVYDCRPQREPPLVAP
jgi:hypothetical protein